MLFDGAPAKDVRVLSPGRLTAQTPPGTFGAADVGVVNADGRSVTVERAYFYSDLTVTSRVARWDPMVDGTDVRPAGKLGNGTVLSHTDDDHDDVKLRQVNDGEV